MSGLGLGSIPITTTLLYADRDENEARQFIDALLSFLAPEPGSTFH